jgi:hypothetical protein
MTKKNSLDPERSNDCARAPNTWRNRSAAKDELMKRKQTECGTRWMYYGAEALARLPFMNKKSEKPFYRIIAPFPSLTAGFTVEFEHNKS